MMDPQPTDYALLISKAEESVAATERRAQRTANRQSSRWRYVLAGLLLAVTVIALTKIWASFAPPAQDVVVHDLEAIVEQARREIDTARKETGGLPDQLPSAALASVVQYEKREKDYQLTASIMGIRITLDWDGKKRLENLQ